MLLKNCKRPTSMPGYREAMQKTCKYFYPVHGCTGKEDFNQRCDFNFRSTTRNAQKSIFLALANLGRTAGMGPKPFGIAFQILSNLSSIIKFIPTLDQACASAYCA